MTKAEELRYLVELCVAGGSWLRQDGDADGIVLEVQDRIDRLLNEAEEPVREPSSVKVKMPDGTYKRKPAHECHKEPYRCRLGYRWVWDGGAADYDKKAQEDKMWTDHDRLKDAVYDE